MLSLRSLIGVLRILAPITVGILIDNMNGAAAAIWIALFNLVAWGVEASALKAVYSTHSDCFAQTKLTREQQQALDEAQAEEQANQGFVCSITRAVCNISLCDDWLIEQPRQCVRSAYLLDSVAYRM